jgi:NAD(P)-dependent dehydrogenase (short-subunit alcohol dehydrogenase family)
MRVLIAGASGNVGTACINHFCNQEGAQVYGVSRTEPQVKHYDNFHFIKANLAYEPEAIIMPQQFNLVIMAQGTHQKLFIGKHSMELGMEIVKNNLFSAWALTHVLIEFNLLAFNSLIIYSGSLQATCPRAGRGPYAMAKAGIEALTKVIAVEQSPRTRAICLRMGQLTKLMKNITFNPEEAKLIENTVFSKFPSPKEIARFCHDLYNMPGITGAIIDIDSGHHLSVWPGEKHNV